MADIFGLTQRASWLYSVLLDLERKGWVEKGKFRLSIDRKRLIWYRLTDAGFEKAASIREGA